MLQNSNSTKEIHPYVCLGTLVPMDIGILNKIVIFCLWAVFNITKKTRNYVKFGKEIKTVIVVDISLQPLRCTGVPRVHFFERVQ